MRKPEERTVTGPCAPPSREALDAVFSAAYEELRRLALAVKRSDPAATISPTGLVNEAWMKLSRSPAVAFTSHLHFKRIAARAMRQVLIEAARRRLSAKRGGDVSVVTFTESIGGTTRWGQEILALNDALEALAKLSPRQAQMVESRFFGGLEIMEIAELLGISEATVLRDWRASKAWLAREMRRDRQRPEHGAI